MSCAGPKDSDLRKELEEGGKGAFGTKPSEMLAAPPTLSFSLSQRPRFEGPALGVIGICGPAARRRELETVYLKASRLGMAWR